VSSGNGSTRHSRHSSGSPCDASSGRATVWWRAVWSSYCWRRARAAWVAGGLAFIGLRQTGRRLRGRATPRRCRAPPGGNDSRSPDSAGRTGHPLARVHRLPVARQMPRPEPAGCGWVHAAPSCRAASFPAAAPASQTASSAALMDQTAVSWKSSRSA